MVYRIVLAVLAGLLIAACARYPLGMTEAEWQRLTPQQQFEARQQQAEIDRREAAARAAEAEARRIAQERLRLLEEQQFAQAYRHPYACELSGEAVFDPPFEDDFEPTYFRIGERQTVSLLLEEDIGTGRRSFYAELDFSGNNLEICTFDPARGDDVCDRVRLWRGDSSERVYIHDALDGTIVCRDLSGY
jgi:hypothetical protein